MTNTLRRSFSVLGTGLHTGADTAVTLEPAEPGHGIVFYRVDLPSHPIIPATLDSVVYTQRRTVLGHGSARVATVEHLLAAVFAHGIDDVAILVDGPEVPQSDGSAREFAVSLQHVGVTQESGDSSRLVVVEPFDFEHHGATYEVQVADLLEVDVSIEWEHPTIGAQSFRSIVSPELFNREFAAARTFGFVEELEMLRDEGLIGGVSPDSVIALSADGIQHGGPLRWPNEFARHKALDLVGDLALLGGSLAAKIMACRPSHTGNIALARIIQERAQCVPVPQGVAEGTTGKVGDGD